MVDIFKDYKSDEDLVVEFLKIKESLKEEKLSEYNGIDIYDDKILRYFYVSTLDGFYPVYEPSPLAKSLLSKNNLSYTYHNSKYLKLYHISNYHKSLSQDFRNRVNAKINLILDNPMISTVDSDYFILEINREKHVLLYIKIASKNYVALL